MRSRMESYTPQQHDAAWGDAPERWEPEYEPEADDEAEDDAEDEAEDQA